MPLIDLIDQRSAPLLVRDLFADGDPGPIVASLAQVPELCEAALPFLGAALGPSGVSFRRKEIAIVRTSANLACRFCADTHTVVGAKAGLTTSELIALRGHDDVGAVFTDDAELALVDWVDALSTGTGPVDPLVAARARVLLGDHQLVELTVAVGTTMQLNRLATAFGLPVTARGLERLGFVPFRPGGTSAPPTPATTAAATTAPEEVPA